jgi:hypothetical protein
LSITSFSVLFSLPQREKGKNRLESGPLFSQ